MDTRVAYKEGTLIGEYAEFVINVLSGVTPLNIGSYKLQRVPEKEKQTEERK